MQTGHLGTAAEWLQLSVGDVDAALKEAELQLGFMLFASVRGRLQATWKPWSCRQKSPILDEALEPVQRSGRPPQTPSRPHLARPVHPAAGQSTATAKQPCRAAGVPGHSVQPVEPADPGNRQKPVVADADGAWACMIRNIHKSTARCWPRASLQLLAPHGWLNPEPSRHCAAGPGRAVDGSGWRATTR